MIIYFILANILLATFSFTGLFISFINLESNQDSEQSESDLVTWSEIQDTGDIAKEVK